MIDFQNGDIFKLRNTGRFQNEKLIALGLTIVVNSLRSYFKARHNSEVE